MIHRTKNNSKRLKNKIKHSSFFISTLLCLITGLLVGLMLPTGTITEDPQAATSEAGLYTINFYCNGGDYIESMINIIPNSKQILPTPTRKGYWFRGWFEESTFKTPFLSGSYVSKNLDLFAKWEYKEDSIKDTISPGPVSDGTYTAYISADLTGQSYDHTVTFTAVGVDPLSIKKAANSLAEPVDKYMGLDLNVTGLYYNSQLPVPITLVLPPEYNLNETGVYLTTNRSSVMAKVPHTVTSSSVKYRVPNVNTTVTKTATGSTITFNIYQDGTYILLDMENEKETAEKLEPYIEVKYKKYQLAVNREMKMYVKLHNFPEDEMKDYKVVWKSLNPKKVSIDQKGWIKALKKGKVNIRCKVVTKNNTYYKKTQLEIIP